MTPQPRNLSPHSPNNADEQNIQLAGTAPSQPLRGNETLDSTVMRRPILPLFLLILACAAVAVTWLRLHCAEHPPLAPSTERCRHWVGIQVAQSPIQLFCLPVRSLETKSRFRAILQSVVPTCASIPHIPLHGEMLRFVSGSCNVQRLLLPAKQRLLLGIRISINTASFEDLRALPKMNRRTARAILEYRSIHGPFQTWEAVKQVKGVGPKSFRRWKPMLTLQ